MQSDSTQEKLARIGMVADQLGVSERTLRYYEEVGLLRHIRHSPGTARLYCEADIARVKRIKELQTLMGFNLEEIQSIISAEDNLESLRDRYPSESPAGQRKIRIEAMGILEDLRTKVRTKIESLQLFRSALDARIERHHARIDTEK
ncbi:MAG: MerR family transcriptional regulator [Acidimicrobiales bacterium]